MTQRCPVLFLDYDGVLHPAFFLSDANQLAAHVPFEHAPALAAALADVHVDIVLSTDWFHLYGLEGAAALLPDALRAKVIAGIEPRADEKSRFDRIWSYANTRGIDSWLALDDDDWAWAEYARWRLIKPRRMPESAIAISIWSRTCCSRWGARCRRRQACSRAT